MVLIRTAAIAAVTLVAMAACAQVDCDPDGIGIYFDESATVVTAAVEPVSYVTAYLVLTHPSCVGNLYHWEARVSSLLPDAAVFGSAVQGQNLAMNMPGSSACNFIVSLNSTTPYPVSTITILARLDISPYSDLAPLFLMIDEGALYSVDAGAGYCGTSLNPSSGDWNMPVAIINGPAPVAMDTSSWGGIKTTFR